jgi:hypothetical protein
MANSFKENAKKVGGRLLALSARIGIKAATLGLINQSEIDELEGIKDDLSSGVSSMVEKLIEERLSSHSEDAKILQTFRDLLSELPDRLDTGEDKPTGEQDTEAKPLVIIIDELDRCRPTYALDMIEKVKHLFSVRNVVFLLIMNKKQLEESVKCVYGPKIDARAYLQKFINVETSIPKRLTTSILDNDLGKYSEKLLKLHEMQDRKDADGIAYYIKRLSVYFNFSLRELEKVFTNLAVFYISFGKGEMLHDLCPIVAFLTVIKVRYPALFEGLLHQRVTFEEIVKTTGLKATEQQERDSPIPELMRFIEVLLMSEDAYSQLKSKDLLPSDFNVPREKVIPQIAEWLNLFTVRQ